MQTCPGKMMYRSFKEGLRTIAQDDSVMLSDDILLKSFLKSNPFYAQKFEVLSTGRKKPESIKFEPKLSYS
jgi:hypothetical protein